jgi:AAA-like domain
MKYEVRSLSSVQFFLQFMEAKITLDTLKKDLQPRHLTEVEEIIFLRCWAGQSYQEIADELGYNADYVKRIGSQLWNMLSDKFGRKISKKNVKVVASLVRDESDKSKVKYIPVIQKSDFLEFPSSPVPINSSLYIERPPLEQLACTEIFQSGSLIRITAPQQMGKTSFLLRVLDFAQKNGLQTVLLNLQQVDRSILMNLDQFLRWLCYNSSRELGLFPRLDGYWDKEGGSKVSCTVYFQEYLLKNLPRPLVIALDGIDPIFEYPELAQDFLPLLQSWHEEAARLEIWQRLRLVMVYSTEVYAPLQWHQSRFSVGLPIHLPPFNLTQVWELIRRHGFEWDETQVSQWEELHNLVDGHPYLLRLALYWLKQGLSLEQLLQDAPTSTGIYGEHLRRQMERVQAHQGLWEAFQEVIAASENTVRLEVSLASHLESLGLIKRIGNEAIISCKLYQLFFQSQMRLVNY